MNKDYVTVTFTMLDKRVSKDIEIPLFITANELVCALNNVYELGINIADIKKCYLKAERPIALLKGNKTLAEFGVRNGTVIYFTE